jgi:hypothetical protein
VEEKQMDWPKKGWKPDPIAEAIIESLEEELQGYRELVSEFDMEIKFLRKFASKADLKKADKELTDAISKLYDSNISITGY